MAEIIAAEKKFTALIIPNAILVSTLHQKYFFTSFLAREQAYSNIIQIWKEYQRRPLKEALKKSETIFSDDEEEYLQFVDPETKRLIGQVWLKFDAILMTYLNNYS